MAIGGILLGILLILYAYLMIGSVLHEKASRNIKTTSFRLKDCKELEITDAEYSIYSVNGLFSASRIMIILNPKTAHFKCIQTPVTREIE